MNPIVRSIGMAHEKRKIESFEIGDMVNVHVRIKEGEKERIQLFTGTVISRKGIKNHEDGLRGDINASFTVRRLAQGSYGVERIFPLHCPSVEQIEVVKNSRVRRAKLYYLRDRMGKKARLKERRLRKDGEVAGAAPAAAKKPAPAKEAPKEAPEVAEAVETAAGDAE